MKGFINNTLLELGYFTSSLSEKDEVLALLNLLKPLNTEHELIRVGNENGDGGYLIPNDLNDIKYCFSPGVSDEASFEKELSEKGIKCFLADYSVEKSPLSNKNISFTKKFVSSFSNEKYIEINDWINANIGKSEDEGILQMDIEGQEYEVIHAINQKYLENFRIVIVEFHSLHYMLNQFAFQYIKSTFQKLMKSFNVVHLHPNNVVGKAKRGDIEIPKIMEFTFFRRDRISESSKASKFPHKLDKQNTNNKDLKLPGCWYK